MFSLSLEGEDGLLNEGEGTLARSDIHPSLARSELNERGALIRDRGEVGNR